MAVVSVQERHQSRRSSVKDGKATHNREWLVRCDDPADGTAAALTADDGTRKIPPIGTGHPSDPNAKLVGLEASPHESSDVYFLVSGEYQNNGLLGMPANPVDRPPEVSWSYNDATEAYFEDYSTPLVKLVTNSAGDPFENSFERGTGDLIINVASNEETFNVVEIDLYKWTTNENPIVIDGVTYPKGVLLLGPPSASKVVENAEGTDGAIMRVRYYKVSWTVRARRGGWNDKVLDYGLNELVPDPVATKPPKLRPIVDSANLPIKRPWPLDGAGRKKSKYTDKPAELEFVPYQATVWPWRWTKAEAWAS